PTMIRPMTLSFVPYTTLFRTRGLAKAVIKQVTSSLPNLSRVSSTRLVAFHLGFGSLAGYQGPISGSTVVHGHSSAMILGANLPPDRKSTRLNSSHVSTSYAVF